jgi:hypothetical protein
MELLKHPKSQVVISSDENTWISVKERLPDKDGKYLVTLNILGDKSVEIIEYRTNRGWGFFKKKITAWQPSPEPYKEAENE